ncbi:MAG TPA: alpha-L-rhamnosidase N-terminal domain-containing protein, partial [Chitinophagaceae bacterium]|nr:alpha-L-rhamnosidase N-terminal domain-containing protein [Chitinophagaceae bacterium]
MKIIKRLICQVFLFAFAIPGMGQDLALANLRCESRNDPLGIQSAHPRLSWELLSGQRNTTQSAYRILVADDTVLLKNNVGNIWDSRKVQSAASIQVAFRGRALQPARIYYWKLMVWDNKGRSSAWSRHASWQMGLLQQGDWMKAKWIGYDEIVDSAIIAPHMHLNGKKAWGARRNVLPMLRKSFTTAKPLKRATAFICGLGHFEMTVNGTKTGDHFLDPGWTNYSKHALYVTFDITPQLKHGENAVGIMLGNGFYYIPGQRYRKMTGAYGLPKLIFRMLIEYEDGSVQNIISDNSWKTTPSPVIFSSIYGGEDYDAGLEQKDWNQPGFDDRGWKPVILTEGPMLLQSQVSEPVKIMQRLVPRSKTLLKQ